MVLKCPRCGSNGYFTITCESYAVVNDKGETQEMGSSDGLWESTHPCECMECEYKSTISEFDVSCPKEE